LLVLLFLLLLLLLLYLLLHASLLLLLLFLLLLLSLEPFVFHDALEGGVILMRVVDEGEFFPSVGVPPHFVDDAPISAAPLCE